MPRAGYVYLLASRRNGTPYTGVTSDLRQRVWDHKQDEREAFTRKYQVHRLVYVEAHQDIRLFF
jgi:putative endonuclease